MDMDIVARCMGIKIGRAIAKDVIADGLPHKWTGLDAQDGDQLMAAGIEPDSEEWMIAERAAEDAYRRDIDDHNLTDTTRDERIDRWLDEIPVGNDAKLWSRIHTYGTYSWEVYHYLRRLADEQAGKKSTYPVGP